MIRYPIFSGHLPKSLHPSPHYSNNTGLHRLNNSPQQPASSSVEATSNRPSTGARRLGSLAESHPPQSLALAFTRGHKSPPIGEKPEGLPLLLGRKGRITGPASEIDGEAGPG